MNELCPLAQGQQEVCEINTLKLNRSFFRISQSNLICSSIIHHEFVSKHFFFLFAVIFVRARLLDDLLSVPAVSCAGYYV